MIKSKRNIRIMYAISLAMELPWGVLADRIGYKRIMAASCALVFVSKLIFWQAHSFGVFLADRFALSTALAGMSGVSESILYLSCGEDDSPRVFGIDIFLQSLIQSRGIIEKCAFAV